MKVPWCGGPWPRTREARTGSKPCSLRDANEHIKHPDNSDRGGREPRLDEADGDSPDMPDITTQSSLLTYFGRHGQPNKGRKLFIYLARTTQRKLQRNNQTVQISDDDIDELVCDSEGSKGSLYHDRLAIAHDS